MNWKKEVARDLIALGGIPFFGLVIIRSLIGEFMTFFYQLIIALVVSLILAYILKRTNQPMARGIILIVFTSLYYQHNLFTAFAILLGLLILGSLVYSKVEKNSIVKGIIVGVVSVLVAYFVAPVL
tara:strand:+ start:354 stop:731 length:378 start_codon:yes stop_codon:yes gene_type:complete